MNRLKREKILTIIVSLCSVIILIVGYIVHNKILLEFGVTLSIISLLYSVYLSRQINKQKEENQRRKSI